MQIVLTFPLPPEPAPSWVMIVHECQFGMVAYPDQVRVTLSPPFQVPLDNVLGCGVTLRLDWDNPDPNLYREIEGMLCEFFYPSEGKQSIVLTRYRIVDPPK